MTVYIVWSMKRLVNAICDRLQNEFDVFMIIEGKRGLGKSTLGFRLMLKVKREMKKRGVDGYQFKPYFDLLYTRKEVLKFFHKWKKSGMADEMINVSFNRDFYDPQQKDLIKMINMNRDHSNFFIACVPQFKVLDSQIKNLCSMKITVVRRGVAIIHTPNKTVYASDIWDERFNEKIERDWLKGGIKNPKYSRLTTFRGFLKFPKLTARMEEIYQDIKNKKRNIIAQEQGLEEVDVDDPFTKIYTALMENKVETSQMLNGMIIIHGLRPDNTRAKIRKKLREEKKPTRLSLYYNNTKEAEKEMIKKKKRNELNVIIDQVRNKVIR